MCSSGHLILAEARARCNWDGSTAGGADFARPEFPSALQRRAGHESGPMMTTTHYFSFGASSGAGSLFPVVAGAAGGAFMGSGALADGASKSGFGAPMPLDVSGIGGE
jgi:hypothetical protein